MITDEETEGLRGIVGQEWVSTSACMLDTYSFYLNPETVVTDGSKWLPRPVAVVLPKDTKEVQEIMRFCNRNHLMAKPLSTGFHAVCSASRDRVIVLDLKRMNRIIDIDAKNQVAIVEPYVRAIDLQTEAFKSGLTVHTVSAGSNHSILASTAAAWGYGASGPSTSYSGRNLLGVEWVLPTGEVLTLGSGGAGTDWFTADGPGPSLRGIVRGFQGTFGGLGVFTKCAVKLYTWNGPAEWKFHGRSPVYVLERIPERMAMNVHAFPTADAMANAGYKLGEAEIEFACFRTPAFLSALGMTENNEELKVAMESGFFDKAMHHVLINAVIGYSDGEFKWKMAAMKQIMRETGGVKVPMSIRMTPGMFRIMKPMLKHVGDPFTILRRFPRLQDIINGIPVGKRQKLQIESRLFWLLIRNAVNTQATFRPSQGMSTMLGSFDTWDMGIKQGEWVARAKKKYIERGTFLDDGGDLGCGGTFENSHLGYLEGIFMYASGDPEALRASHEVIEDGCKAAVEEAMGIPIAAFGCEMNKRFGPACRDYPKYMSKIKKALDPNTASDPFFYAEPEEG